MTSAPPQPTDIRKVGNSHMKITWSDGQVKSYTAQTLRQACPCASCRNELTGERILDPATVSSEIKILKVELTGSYALSFTFSDNHSTGIYTFQSLYELSGAID